MENKKLTLGHSNCIGFDELNAINSDELCIKILNFIKDEYNSNVITPWILKEILSKCEQRVDFLSLS